MIPLLATVSIRHPRGAFRIWAPLFLLWLLLLPLMVVALPMAAIWRLAGGRDFFPVIAGIGGVLCAASGTHVQVQAPGTEVLVRIL